MILASFGENAHPAEIEALKQNKLQGIKPANVIKNDLDNMQSDLERKQKLVAEIAVKRKNDEFEGGSVAIDMEEVKTENGKSLSTLKKEINDLSLKIAEYRYLLERSEYIEKALSKPSGNSGDV